MKKRDYKTFTTSAIIIILLAIILFIHPQWQMEKRYKTYIIDEIESVSGEIESLFESNINIAHQIYLSKQVTPKRMATLKDNLQQIKHLLQDSILGNLRTYYLGEVSYIIDDQSLMFKGIEKKISQMEEREKDNRYYERFICNTHYKDQVMTSDDLNYCRPPIPYETLEFLVQYRHISYVYSFVIDRLLDDHDIYKLSLNYRHMITNRSWKRLDYWRYLDELESFTVD